MPDINIPLDIYVRLMDKPIVIYDIDNTLIDVTDRYIMSLREIGLREDADLKRIDAETRNRFWRVFLSDRYLHLDKPNKVEIERLRRLREDGYGIILITGRPEYMRGDTLRQLREFNIPFDALIMRDNRDRSPDKVFKLSVIRRLMDLGLNIIEYHEDDEATVERVREEYPMLKTIKHGLYKDRFHFQDEDT